MNFYSKSMQLCQFFQIFKLILIDLKWFLKNWLELKNSLKKLVVEKSVFSQSINFGPIFITFSALVFQLQWCVSFNNLKRFFSNFKIFLLGIWKKWFNGSSKNWSENLFFRLDLLKKSIKRRNWHDKVVT